MAGADATVYVWHLFILCLWPINQTYAVASASTATGSVLIRKFRVFVGTVWPCPVRIICGDRHSVAWSSKDDRIFWSSKDDRIFWSLGQPQYIIQQVKNVSSQPDSNPWTPNHLLSRHLDFLCL